MTMEETLLKKTELGRVDYAFFLEQFSYSFACCYTLLFRSSYLGCNYCFLIWEYPDKRSNESNEIEYEVHDDEE